MIARDDISYQKQDDFLIGRCASILTQMFFYFTACCTGLYGNHGNIQISTKKHRLWSR